MEFNRQELNKIRIGVHPDWSRVGDDSAYGGVFKSPKYPGKVIKIQSGNYGTWKNETDKQFRAMELNDGVFEVPNIGDSGFIPDNPSKPMDWVDPKTGIKGRNPTDTGLSYISMDEADYAEMAGAQKQKRHAAARALTDLYMKGISHADDHSGNIKFNPKTGKAVLLDFGLAHKVDGPTDTGKRTEWIQNALKNSDNTDMLELWDEQHYELQQEHMLNPTKESAAALEDWRRQGQEVAVMTHPNIAPVNFSEDAFTTPASSRDAKPNVLRSGPREWGKTPPELDVPGTSWFEGQLAAKGSPIIRPLRRTANAAKGALSFGLTDLIPSREVVREAFQKGPGSAVQRHAGEIIHDLPYALGIGATALTIPAIATGATAAAPYLALYGGAQAIDESVKQKTGEHIIPKVQQALGTKPRTGRVEGSIQEKHKAEMQRIAQPPQIKPQTRKPRTQVKDLPLPELGRRLRLASQRYNPGMGEFGLSELIFGR